MAQKIEPLARINLSIGTEYKELDYAGGTLLYSTGGGIGLEAGLKLNLAKKFFIQTGLAYQLHLALQSESFNGISNTSRFNFNRKSINLGTYRGFSLNDKLAHEFILGVGANLNIPGKLTRIENDESLGSIEYDPSFGLYAEVGFKIPISNITLMPNFRYRILGFSARRFSDGHITQLPDYLRETNSNGFELGLTITPKMK